MKGCRDGVNSSSIPIFKNEINEISKCHSFSRDGVAQTLVWQLLISANKHYDEEDIRGITGGGGIKKISIQFLQKKNGNITLVFS